jgi:hypothetical protein
MGPDGRVYPSKAAMDAALDGTKRGRVSVWEHENGDATIVSGEDELEDGPGVTLHKGGDKA